MVKPALPDTETIMIKFSAIKLPLDVDIVAFREEFRNILKGELGKLAEKYDSLKILNVEQRNGRRAMTKVAKVLGATGSSG